MKAKHFQSAAVALAVFSGVLTTILTYYYIKELQTGRKQALSYGQQQAAKVQQSIDTEFKAQMEVADTIASDLTSGELAYSNVASHLREEVNRKPNIYGLGVAFEPFHYKSDVKLFAPYYRKDDAGQFIRTQTEETYDYTNAAGSNAEWYVSTLEKGKAGWYVFYDASANTTLIEYAVPFFAIDPNTNKQIPMGVVHIDHSVETIKEFLRSIDVGQEGYTALISPDGRFIVHPRITFVNRTIEQLSQAYNVPTLLEDWKRISQGDTFYTEGSELTSGESIWRFYNPLAAAGWYLNVVIKQNANDPSAEYSIRSLINIGLAALAFIFFLAAIASGREGKTIRRVWMLSISATLVLVAAMAWVWSVVSSHPIYGASEDVLVNPANVEASLQPVEEQVKQYNQSDIIRIPTGITVQTLSVSPTSASVSGYIWQKYPTDLPDDITRGFSFPNALNNPAITEVYRFTKGDTEVIGWFFVVNTSQRFNLSNYPLDQANVQIHIWPRELDHSIVLVPDFNAYEFMAPSEKPGLVENLPLVGWSVNRSCFSFVRDTYNADFGSVPVLQRNNLPTLSFNINATRNLLSPIIAFCITAIVVASMLFGIQLVNVNTPYNVLANASSLFFVVAITHVGLRSSLNASGVVYLEYLFIVEYVYILAGAVNGMLYYSSEREDWIHYEKNIIPKVMYWPAFLLTLLIISLVVFYPLKASAQSLSISSIQSGVPATVEPSASTPQVSLTQTASTVVAVQPQRTAVPVASKSIEFNKDMVTLRYPIYANPTTLDPSLSNRYDSTEQIGNLFMGLTHLDPVSLEVQPWLAESWQTSEDGLTWTFKLPADIPWVEFIPSGDGNGGEARQVTDFQGNPRFVTADDVVYGIRRSLTLKNPSAQLLFNIENSEDVFNGAQPAENLGVEAVSTAEVRFTLNSPAPYFPELLSYDVTYPIPSWALEEWADDWTDVGKINTNGPFLLAGYQPDQSMRLTKNPFWPQAASVQIDIVDEPILADPQTVVEMYFNNQLDTISNPSNALLDAVKSNALLAPDLMTYTKLCTQYIGFVNTKAPFNDARVRRAFSAAIDREFITNQILKNGSQPATVFSPPGVFGAVTDPSVGQGYDPDTAKALFDDYLNERGLTVGEFNTAYKLTFGQLSTSDDINQAILASWNKVLGVKVTLVTAPNDDLSPYDHKNVPLAKAFSMFQGNWCADYPDQDNFIRFLFNSQTGSNNVRRNCADEICTTTNAPTKFDELTEAASNTTDPDERKQLYAEAEQILAVEEAAYAPVFFDGGTAIVKEWLTRNFPALGAPDFFTWMIDTSKQVTQ